MNEVVFHYTGSRSTYMDTRNGSPTNRGNTWTCNVAHGLSPEALAVRFVADMLPCEGSVSELEEAEAEGKWARFRCSSQGIALVS